MHTWLPPTVATAMVKIRIAAWVRRRLRLEPLHVAALPSRALPALPPCRRPTACMRRPCSQRGVEGDGWDEPANLSSLAYSESGSNKSTTLRFFIRHLEHYCKMFSVDILTTTFTIEAALQFIADNDGDATAVLDECNVRAHTGCHCRPPTPSQS